MLKNISTCFLKSHEKFCDKSTEMVIFDRHEHMEYGKIEETIAQVALTTITDWLLKQISR